MTATYMTARDLDLTEREEKIIMMVMQVAAVPPDMPADLALQILRGAGERGGNTGAARPAEAAKATRPGPSQGRQTWMKIRGPLVIGIFASIFIYANFLQ